MKISNIDPGRIDDFLKFNCKIFPERKNISKRFSYQIIENPLLQDKSRPHGFICLNDNNEIAGQFLVNPFEFHFSGSSHKGYFGCDYYVSEDYRGMNGAVLACKAIRSCRPYFAIGLTETAKKIHLSLGTKAIGNLVKFVWFRNMIKPALMAAKLDVKDSSKEKFYRGTSFPEKISVRGAEFQLLKKLDDWDDYHWENTLEFSRSPEFLRWRFFGNLKGYYFYLSKKFKKPSYFVARRSIWRGLCMLLVVDYKVADHDEKAFRSIIKASKSLAKEIRCDGVIFFSSHIFFDSFLKRNLFLKIGNPYLMLTNADIEAPSDRIDKREFLTATLAESDIDFDFDEGLCEYGF